MAFGRAWKDADATKAAFHARLALNALLLFLYVNKSSVKKIKIRSFSILICFVVVVFYFVWKYFPFLQDERNQILTTNCWLTQSWNDTRMKWNSSDFGGIRVVRIPYNKLWRPVGESLFFSFFLSFFLSITWSWSNSAYYIVFHISFQDIILYNKYVSSSGNSIGFLVSMRSEREKKENNEIETWILFPSRGRRYEKAGCRVH